MAEETERSRKRPVRSPYLFPAYDLGSALILVGCVENQGGGMLTEESLAVALRSSAKSSSFKLRALTARQFGLMTKDGDRLTTTPLGKAIFKPTREGEKEEALSQAFLRIPLFKAVTDRFKGQPLPQTDVFRNVLEREFGIDAQRVSAAERRLRDSAREAGLMRDAGTNTYLSTDLNLVTLPTPVDGQPTPGAAAPTAEVSRTPAQPRATVIDQGPEVIPAVPLGSGDSGGALVISERDLAEFEDPDFDKVWSALGMVFRARGKRQLATEADRRRSAAGPDAADASPGPDDEPKEES